MVKVKLKSASNIDFIDEYKTLEDLIERVECKGANFSDFLGEKIECCNARKGTLTKQGKKHYAKLIARSDELSKIGKLKSFKIGDVKGMMQDLMD